MTTILLNILGVIILIGIIFIPWFIFAGIIGVALLTTRDEKTLDNKWFQWTVMLPFAILAEIWKLIDKIKEKRHAKILHRNN